MYRRLLCGLALALVAPEAMAERKRSDAEVAQRIDRIEAGFRSEESSEGRWHYGWIAGLGALSAGQGTALLFVDDRARRVSLIYGTASSGIGSFFSLVLGNPALGAADELEAMPSGTPAQRRKKLARAEELLDDSATKAAFDTNPFMGLVLPALGVGALATYLIVELDAPLIAATAVGFSTTISSVRYFSRPTGLLELQEQLDAEDAGKANKKGAIRQRPDVTWNVVPSLRGVWLVGSF